MVSTAMELFPTPSPPHSDYVPININILDKSLNK